MKTTGRKFRCIGLKEKKVHCWKHSFIIGNTYIESEAYLVSDKLNLIGERGSPYFVDASQFELIETC